MFTGIVTALGTVTAVERDDERLSLTIESPYSDLADGDSVAVNGACLTVVETDDRRCGGEGRRTAYRHRGVERDR